MSKTNFQIYIKKDIADFLRNNFKSSSKEIEELIIEKYGDKFPKKNFERIEAM